MSKSKSDKKIKEIKDQVVVMSRIDFEIAKRVYERMQEIGMNDEEFSFLLGKRNKYLFDLLDPTEKNKFKTEQLDYIPTILNTSIRNLVPDNKDSPEQIKVKASKITYDNKIVYKFSEVYPDGSLNKETTWTKRTIIGTRKTVHPELLSFIKELYSNGGFKDPVSALSIYLKAKAKLKETSFTPTGLQKCLSTLITSKGKLQLLTRINEDARYYYKSNSEAKV